LSDSKNGVKRERRDGIGMGNRMDFGVKRI